MQSRSGETASFRLGRNVSITNISKYTYGQFNLYTTDMKLEKNTKHNITVKQLNTFIHN